MSTATDASKKTVEQEISDLRKDFGELAGQTKELVKALNRPDVRTSGDGSLSYWEEGESIAAMCPVDGDGNPDPRPLRKSRRQSLPKGYKNDKWPTYGAFIREGYLAAKSHQLGEFQRRYADCFKGIDLAKVDGSLAKAVQGMSVQDGSSAGVFVLPEFNQNVLGRSYANDILSRTDSYVVNNNMVFLANAETSRANGSRHGGLRAYWVDEGATMTKSKPTMRRIEVSLKKVAIIVYLTEELIADGGRALESYVNRKVDEELNFAVGDAIFNGSGVQMPLGILNSPALLAITKEQGQQGGTIVAENIDKMWARRHAAGNYAWYHNQDCGPQLDQLSQAVGTGGVVLYREQNGIASAAPMLLKSAPRVETEFNPTVGTVGDLLLADLMQYITITKGGVMQSYSTELEFLTDQVALKFTLRMNGRPWETTPLTPFKGSNTQASFVALETRS